MSSMKALKISALVTFALVGCSPQSGKRAGDSDPINLPFTRPAPEHVDPWTDLKHYGDYLRDEDPEVRRLLNDPALTAVTNTFGLTTVSLKNLPLKTEAAIATITPWSSWWYPRREDYLFNDRAASTLAKYDLYRRRRYQAAGRRPPESAREYEASQYNPNSLSWEGLCDAWALAAITQPEPKTAVNLSAAGTMIYFSIADLKALLLMSYAAIDDSALRYYGQRFTGNFEGWIYPDIFPEQFHRFVEVQLFGRRLPFIMDHDAGIEVWNVPVFKANYSMEAVPDDPDAVFVRMWLFSAESTNSNDKNYVGTRTAIREYNYVLKGTRDQSDNLIVHTGYWVKGPDGIDSRKKHPDYLIEVKDPSAIKRKSWNPEVEPAIVDEILSQSL